MKMKTIIFDFDGTIVNSRDLIIQLYNELAEKNNYIPINQANFKELTHIPILDRCKRLKVPLYKIPSLLVKVMGMYKSHLSSLQIHDDVSKLIINLKSQGYRLLIVSSNSENTIRDVLKMNNIDIFDSIFSSKLFGKHKVINSMLKKFSLETNDVIYIGDEVRDIVSCQKSKIKIVAVTWGYDSPELLRSGNPDYIVDNPLEIRSILQELQEE